MSQQFSQYSEGGFSDIIPDVDNFIEENGIIEDVGHLLGAAEPNQNFETEEEEDDCKYVIPVESFGSSDQPTQSLTTELQYPPDQPHNLCTEEYPGPFNFEVFIVPSEQKTPWEYSAKLNKIFIGINLKFPVAFSLEHRPNNLNLFIRATPVFSQSQFFQEVVHRCVGHQHAQDPSNKGLSAHVFQHIIRCTNDRTRYFGDIDTGGRFNIVVPLARPQAGTDVVKEFYHFVCKNSCPLGMNRRPIDVVFSLEDENGEVYGRRLVSVRICSCPKRDKEKEEKDVEKNGNQQQGRKRKLPHRSNGGRDGGSCAADVRVLNINMNIVGEKNYLHTLGVARDRMAAEILKLEDRNNDNPFVKSYNEISDLIEKATKGSF